MPLPPRLFAGDEELGKKNDDHKPGKGMKSPLGIAWQQRRLPYGPQRRNMKRVALGLVVLISLYYFFKNMPTDLENPRPWPHYDHNPEQPGPAQGSRPPAANQGSMQKPGHVETAKVPQHYFNGPIKFYQLASTLHAVSKTRGAELVNRNVVYSLENSVELSTNHCLAICCSELEKRFDTVTHSVRDGDTRKELRSLCLDGERRYFDGYIEVCQWPYEGVQDNIPRCEARSLPPLHGLSHGSQLLSRFQPYKYLRPSAGNVYRCVRGGGAIFHKGFEGAGEQYGPDGDRTS